MCPKHWGCVVVPLILAGSAVTDLQNPVGHEPSASRLRIMNERSKGVKGHQVKFFTGATIWSSRSKPSLAATERSEVTARVEQPMPLQARTMLPVTPGVLKPFVTSIHDLSEDSRAAKNLQRAPQNKFPTWSGRVGPGRIAFPGRSPPVMPFPDRNDVFLLQSAS